MNKMYTQTQIERANSTDIAEFLVRNGEGVTKSGKEYRWIRHDSLVIKENRWYRHSKATGGYPIHFVMEFFDKSFPEAVRMLIHEEGDEEAEKPNSVEFKLPPRAESNANVIWLFFESIFVYTYNELMCLLEKLI